MYLLRNRDKMQSGNGLRSHLIPILATLLLTLLPVLAEAQVTNINGYGDSGSGTLRNRVNNASDGDTLRFNDIGGGTINLNSVISITNDVVIIGEGRGKTIIDAGSGSRIFEVGNHNVTIIGMTLLNGVAPDGAEGVQGDDNSSDPADRQGTDGEDGGDGSRPTTTAGGGNGGRGADGGNSGRGGGLAFEGQNLSI